MDGAATAGAGRGRPWLVPLAVIAAVLLTVGAIAFAGRSPKLARESDRGPGPVGCISPLEVSMTDDPVAHPYYVPVFRARPGEPVRVTVYLQARLRAVTVDSLDLLVAPRLGGRAVPRRNALHDVRLYRGKPNARLLVGRHAMGTKSRPVRLTGTVRLGLPGRYLLVSFAATHGGCSGSPSAATSSRGLGFILVR